MANEFVARNGLIAQANSQITGSLIVSNGITGSISGSVAGTASFADNAGLLDGFDSSNFAFSSSFNSYTSSINSYTSSLNSKTSSFATTGSNTFIGTQVMSNAGNYQAAVSGTAAGAYTQLYFDAGRDYGIGVGNASETAYGVANKFFLFDHAVTAMRLVVDENGNMALGGKVTPNAKLDVSGSTNITGSVGIIGSLALNGSNVVLTNQTSSFVLNSQTSSMSVLSASYAATASRVNILTGSGNLGASQYSIPFVGTNQDTPGAQQLYITGSDLSYEPQIYTLNVRNLNGTASRATTASYADNADLLDGLHASVFVQNSQTSSFVLNSQTSSFATFTALNSYTSSINSYTSSLNSTTSSFVRNSQTSSMSVLSASYAATASFAGNFTVANTLTAQTLVVQTVTSSVIYSSGSNVFGNSLSNTQVLTGSVIVTGSLSVNGSNVILTNQTSSFTLNSQTSSFATFTALNSYTSSLNNFSASILSYTSSLNNATSSFVRNSQTSSMSVLSASFAITASTVNIIPNPGAGQYPIVFSALSGAGTGSQQLASTGSTFSYEPQGGLLNVQRISGTASYADNANTLDGLDSTRFATTGSNTFNGNQLITGSLTVGSSSLGPNENTITLGARDTVNEGGQIGFSAPGGTYTSASFIDNWQNFARILRGTNASSTGLVAQWNLGTLQMELPGYTNASSFVGTATANLAVDSSGKVITVSTSGAPVFPYVGNAVITGSLTVTQPIYVPINGAMYFQGGDDAALYDVNIVNTMGIYGVQDITVGAVKLGSDGPVLYGSGSRLGIGTTLPTSASLTVNGNIWATSLTGSLLGTASYASNSNLLDGLDSTQFTLTSSFNAYTSSINTYTSSLNSATGAFATFTTLNAYTASTNNFSASILSYTSSLNSKTSSFATTGSNTFVGNQIITGSLIVTGSTLSQNGSNVVLTNQTSSFTLNSQTSSFVLNSQTSSFVQNSQTGAFATFTALNAYTSSTNNFTASILSYTSSLNSATSSFVLNSQTSSMSVLSASYAATASTVNTIFVPGASQYFIPFVTNSDSGTGSKQLYISGSNFSYEPQANTLNVPNLNGTASRATTASYAATASFAGNFTVANTLTAQTIVVQTVTSSIIYSSGSNTFGNSLANTQVLTGSVIVTGSLSVNGSNAVLSNQTSSLATYTDFNAYTSSINTYTSSLNSKTSSFATTGSNSFTGNQIIQSGLRFGIGNVVAASLLGVSSDISGSTTAYGISVTSNLNVGVTTNAVIYRSFPIQTSGGPYTAITHYLASTNNIAGTVTNQYGFFADSSLNGATNDYGFYGNLASGSNQFNLYMNGTAPNYLAGALGVGVTPSATAGRIDASNDVVAYSTSDIRFKENINPIDNALEKLDQIGGYTFDWKTEEELVSLHGFKGHDVGVIAQEIEAILPEVVTTRDSGYKAVKYEKIVPLLIQAIKEQQEQIKELQDIIKNK